jgi:predicted ribosome-associated RNA-binding protein Tma20
MAEGKQLAVCIGLMKLSTQEMYVLRSSQAYFLIMCCILSLSLSLSCCSASINKGVGVESIHYLGDGLWRMKEHT